jgi:alkylation response protein AidB-like acyl-CoA dehydrogenase
MVRDLLADRCTEEAVRAAADGPAGHDPDLYRTLAGLGLTGLAIPEAYGGAGAGSAEVGAVLVEAGRALLGGPYLPTVALATPALLLSGDADACARYLPGIADGSVTAAVALTGVDGRYGPDAVEVAADSEAAEACLTGSACFVVGGAGADLLVVLARTPDGATALYSVDGAADGLVRTPLPTLDLTRAQAHLEFAGTPGRRLGEPGAGWATARGVLDHGLVALAAEQVGGARACLETAVAYAGTRVQFGRAISSFQALKHRCADLLVEIDAAEAAAAYALWAADRGTGELPAAAALVGATCAEAFVHAAEENIQIHGGIAFTWDHGAHLYFRRAHSSALLLGAPDDHRERLVATALG